MFPSALRAVTCPVPGPTRQTLPWKALPHSPCTPPPLAVQAQPLGKAQLTISL